MSDPIQPISIRPHYDGDELKPLRSDKTVNGIIQNSFKDKGPNNSSNTQAGIQPQYKVEEPVSTSTNTSAGINIGSMFRACVTFLKSKPSIDLKNGDIGLVKSSCEQLIIAKDATDTKRQFNLFLDNLDNKFEKGITYLREQVNNMDQLTLEDRRSLLEFIIEFTLDRKYGTSHFIVDGNFRYDENKKYKSFKKELQEFWIHTPEMGFKVKVFLEFLVRVEEVNEVVDIKGKDSVVVHRSDSATIYQVPVDEALARVQEEVGKEFHESDFFNMEAQRIKLKMPNDQEFVGLVEDEGQGKALHDVINSHDRNNCVAIEKVLTQTAMKPVLSLSWKNIQRKDFKGDVAEISPRQISTDQLPMQIEERDGKSYTTSGKVFGYRESAEGAITKVNYIENVLVTDRNNPVKEYLYTIEYALFVPPKDQDLTATKPQASDDLILSINSKRKQALLALQGIVDIPFLSEESP
jgi:hypothetical protein